MWQIHVINLTLGVKVLSAKRFFHIILFLSHGIWPYHWCNYHNDTSLSSSVSMWPCTRSQQRDWGKLLSYKLIRPSVVFQMPRTFLMMHNVPGLHLWIRSDIKLQVLSAGHWSGPKLENWPYPSWSRNFSPLWHPDIHYHIHSGLSVYLCESADSTPHTRYFLISG